MTAPTLIKGLEDASLALQDALATHAGAVAAQADAKRSLELAKAHLLVDGVDGRNEAQREAVMRLRLEHEHDALHAAEQALTESRCALDCARLDWDLARYMVRAMELDK